MTGGKKPEQRNVRTSDGNYNESVGRDYVQGNVYYNINLLPWLLTGLGLLALIFLLVPVQNLTTSPKFTPRLPSRKSTGTLLPPPPQEWCQQPNLSSESKHKIDCDGY